ncbi:MAG: hypothetical protein CMK07_10310 [Ponticaulis sp.]|nr:hypothetical protein [Ponticaulis sp.]
MKAIIHAGGYKTGSTSIQKALSRLEMPNHHYVEWRSPHHSPMLAMLFKTEPEKFQYFKVNGEKRAALLKERVQVLEEIAELCRTSSKEHLILSSEMLTTKKNVDILENMAAFLKQNVTGTRAIFYARSPVTFMQSAFQQKVKHGRTDGLNLRVLWPHYQREITRLDQAFGADNVDVFKFDPASFPQNSAVHHFADVIGVELGKQKINRVNDSLSLEALSLVFVQRQFGSGPHEGFAGAIQRNKGFIETLQAINENPVVFSETLVSPMIDHHREMVNWLEARIGTSMIDKPKSGEVLISNEQDLFDTALQQRDALRGLIEARLDKPGKLKRLGVSADQVTAFHARKATNMDSLVADLELLKALT